MNISVFYPAGSYAEFPPNDNIDSLSPWFHMENIPPLSRSKYKEFTDLIKHQNIKVLVAWRGGKIENGDTHKSSVELTELLTAQDYAEITKNNIHIVGLSDISFLHSSLLCQDIVSYYGPNINSSLLDSSYAHREIMFSYLSQALQRGSFSIHFCSAKLNQDDNYPWVFSEGTGHGRVSGGNLDTLCEIIKRFGAEKTGVQAGDLLFLEENDPKYSLTNGDISQSLMYQNLNLLKEAGLFDGISGLILGRSKTPSAFDVESELFFDDISNNAEKKYLMLVLQMLDLKGIPIIANIPCGHATPTVTLPLGRKAYLDTASMTLSYEAF